MDQDVLQDGSAADCVRELPAGWCHICTSPPRVVNPSGFTTRGGRAFHSDRDCEWLRRGQRRADRAGLTLHDITRVRWLELDRTHVEPC